jgi:WD40 repeat protein
VVFSPDGALLLSGSADSTIRMWDARNDGHTVGILDGHTEAVLSVAFSPDSTRMASGSFDDTIRIWDMRPRKSDGGDASDDWRLREDGWVIDRDGRILLWVPVDLHTGLMQPRNTAVIRREGSLQFNFKGTAMGEQWGECYS